MTWSMFAINYLDLNDTIKADQHFRNGYQRYLQPPFLIWREVAVRGGEQEEDTEPPPPPTDTSAGDKDNTEEETGAVNFLTGAGGFLQSILFGYAGLRVLSDNWLVINEPHLTPATNELIINGIKYRGLSIDLIVRRRQEEEKEEKGQQQQQQHHHNRYSLRFRECSGARRIIMRVNDTEISVDCRHHRSDWCKYLTWIVIELGQGSLCNRYVDLIL